MKHSSVFILGLMGAILLALASGWMLDRGDQAAVALRVVLVDASASVSRPSPDYSRRVRAHLEREAKAAELASEQLAVIVVANSVRRAFGPGDPAEFRDRLRGLEAPPFDPLDFADDDDQSQLAAALSLVTTVIDELEPDRASLLILGDGTYTSEDPLPRLQRLAARGLNWRGLVSLLPSSTDVALSAIELPSKIEPGAPLVGALRVDIRMGQSGNRVWDRIEIVAKNNRGTRTVALDLWDQSAGKQSEFRPQSSSTMRTFTIGPAEPGRTVIEARLVDTRNADAFDPIPENDRLSGVVTVGDPLVFGWLSSDTWKPQLKSYFSSQLGDSVCLALEPQEVASALPELDALVVFDRSLLDLPADLVQSFVRSGGGLFVAGGWDFLGTWKARPGLSQLADSLPLRPDTDGSSTREVLVMVDGSGSMQGAPFEMVRAAVRELVRAAPERDEIELVFFTGALHKRQLLRTKSLGQSSPSERERLAGDLLDARVPGGTTQILDSLEQLLAERRSSETEALVFLLTDGREQADVLNAELRAQRLREELATTRTHLVVFAVGEKVDLDFLNTLVSQASDLHAGDEIDDLGALFGREVNRERVREAATIGLLKSNTALAQEVFPSSVEPANLKRLIRAQLRATATAVLVSELGEPVLACQRVARGRSVLFASLPFWDWSSEWETRLADLTPALRWCARRPQGAELPTVAIEGRQLVVRGLDPTTPLLIDGRLRDGRGNPAETDRDEAILSFAWPMSAAGLASPGTRVALLGEQQGLASSAVRVLELRTKAGQSILSLPVPPTRRAEFREPRLLCHFPTREQENSSHRLDRTKQSGRAQSAHRTPRKAFWSLVAGSALVLAAAWRLARGANRKGVSRSGR